MLRNEVDNRYFLYRKNKIIIKSRDKTEEWLLANYQITSGELNFMNEIFKRLLVNCICYICVFYLAVRFKKGGGVLNIVPYVWTVRARAFVFQICNPCEKNFYWIRRTLTLWPRPWRTHVYILTFFLFRFYDNCERLITVILKVKITLTHCKELTLKVSKRLLE